MVELLRAAHNSKTTGHKTAPADFYLLLHLMGRGSAAMANLRRELCYLCLGGIIVYLTLFYGPGSRNSR